MAKKDQEIEGAEFEMDADHAETRVYELGFHIDPELPQEEVKKAYAAVRESITAGGTVIAEGEPQKIPLAYTIFRSEHAGRRDFDSAYFAWIAYEANGPAHEAITSAARENTKLVRFIDLRTTKEGAKHSAEMHEIYKNIPVDQMTPEEVSDVELDAALKEAGAAV